MGINIKMPPKLKSYYRKELQLFRQHYSSNSFEKAWRHLERAHILGQRYPLEHSWVHWQMFLFGLAIKDYKEILGQIPRLLFGGVKSFVGRIPVGNPGGANVPPLRPYPIDEELQEVFRKAGVA